MSRPIILFEYTAVRLNDARLASLDHKFIDKFDAYLERTYKNRPLAIDRAEIKPKSMVGTILFKNTQFEILPKLLGGDEIESKGRVYRNLLVMLALTKNISITATEIQKLSEVRSGLLEIYMRIFADTVEREILLRPHRNYVVNEENLHCVRGRILFVEQLKRNLIHRERSFCEFDEFSENNELNKLLKYVARSLFKRTTVGATLAKLKTIEMYLSDVTYEEFSGSRASAIKLNRLNNNYSAALKIAQLFVRGFGIQSRVGHDENFGILFDMNRLFEEFITVTCAHFAQDFGIDVRSQKRSSLAIAYRDVTDAVFTEARSFGTRSDIVITRADGSAFVIDTKYKLLDLKDKKTFGVSNVDVNQVLAYASILSRKGGSVLPVLLYPQAVSRRQGISYSHVKTSGDDPKPFLVMTTSLFEDSYPASVDGRWWLIFSRGVRSHGRGPGLRRVSEPVRCN